jgi:hypothetical protein
VPIVLKSGSLNLLEPSGPVKACNGIALPFMSCYVILYYMILLIETYNPKKVERRVDVKLYSFLTWAQDEVICQRHAPAAIFPGMTRDVLCERVGRAQARFRLVRKILPSSGLDPPTV